MMSQESMLQPLETRRLFAGPVHAALSHLSGTTISSAEQAVSGIEGGGSIIAARVSDDIVIRGYDASYQQNIAYAVASESATGIQARPDVDMWADGSFVVIWVDYSGRDGDGYGIYARTFSDDGTPTSGDILVNVSTTGRQDRPAVATGADGEFIVAWESDHPGRGFRNYDIMARRFVDGIGGDEMTVSSVSSWEPAIAMNAHGQAIVAYMDASGPLRAASITGEAVTPFAQVVSNSGGTPDVTFRPGGSFAVAFEKSAYMSIALYDDASSAPQTLDLSPPEDLLGQDVLYSTPKIVCDSSGLLATAISVVVFDEQTHDFTASIRFSTMHPQSNANADTMVTNSSSNDLNGLIVLEPGVFSFQTRSRRETIERYLDLSELVSDADDDVVVINDDPESGLTIGINGAINTYRGIGSRLQIDLGDGNNSLSGGALKHAALIIAGAGNDDLSAGDGHDTIQAGDGSNNLIGGDGNDTITGGAGRDTLDGGFGDDYIFGSGDRDLIYGNAGNDNLLGGGGSNTIFGGTGDDRLRGSSARDLLVGEWDRDRIYGMGGNDTLDGGSGVDRLYGGDGDDLLIGGSSNDRLYGETGNDTLFGKTGNDVLNGGQGTDTRDAVGSDMVIEIP